MSRFVLRYGGSDAIPAGHLNTIRSTPGLKVIDESPRMLLVDGEQSSLQEKLKDMPGWSLHPEQTYPMPDTRKRLA
ncbi:MAG TPA: hypothetical protein VMJ35_09685 [Dongiaceae bacterium]|nr:hypothetical protein [Dongiaceae bacterium]